jgi:hypothetical protein
MGPCNAIRTHGSASATMTCEETIQCSSTKHKNGGDVERPLSDMAAIVFDLPTAPTAVPPDRVPERDMMTWKMMAQSSLQK